MCECKARLNDSNLEDKLKNKPKDKPTTHKPAPVKEQQSILKEAEDIVNGQRQSDFGDCRVSFKKIATVASVLCSQDLSDIDCVRVLKAVKLVRESYKHKRDNGVDECGYTWIEHKILDEPL